MELSKAKAIAERVVEALRPFCERIEIAGSIRREKPEVKDIEVVCIPRVRDMFGFINQVLKWKKVKGEPTGKYTQRILPEGIALDLFMARKDNWGLIYAIRTGSADFSHKVLASGWVANGYNSKDGTIHKNGKAFPMLEEEDVFAIAGIPYKEPFKREL